jgi:serine/threonine protein kinase
VSTNADGSYLVKVSDFELSRSLEENSYYSAKEEAVIPVKWSAPEVLKYRKFQLQSDVYSFSVTLWELFSEASTPWPGISNREAVDIILRGEIMNKPANCPDQVYELIQCWKTDPDQRATFSFIHPPSS